MQICFLSLLFLVILIATSVLDHQLFLDAV